MNSADLRIDLTKTALLIIDVQRALFARPTPIYEADKLIKNISGLYAYPAATQILSR